MLRTEGEAWGHPDASPFPMCITHVVLGKKFVTRQLSPGRMAMSSLATKRLLAGGAQGVLPCPFGWVTNR